MKRISRLKLTKISQDELTKRDQSLIRGGEEWSCTCGCGPRDTGVSVQMASVLGYYSERPV